MTIPNIAAYRIPPAAELPNNRVHWQLEPARAALLIHDMQEYFLRFFDHTAEPLTTVIDHIAQIAQRCRACSVPVFYSAQPAQQSAKARGLLQDMWGPGITAAPEQAQAVTARLKPEPSDVILTKLRYNAFHGTELLSQLRALGRDQLIVCGVYAHIGCLLTAAAAFTHDVQPFLVSDAVADFSLEHHALALTHAANCCAYTLDTSAVLQALAARESAPAEPTAEWLHQRIAALLELPLREVSTHDDLFDLGLDSIRLMSLVEQVRARGVELTFEDLAECRTVEQLSSLIDGAPAYAPQVAP